MEETYIGQIQPGREVSGTFALRSMKLLPYRDGSGNYLAVVLGDRTGQVEGRVWEPTEEMYQSCKPGEIVKVRGQVTEYNGRMQIQVTSMDCCRDGRVDPRKFIPPGNIEEQAAREKLFSLIDSLENKYLKDLLSIVFKDDDFTGVFITAPAAKRNHHATIGGLLEHSLGVACAAGRIAPAYPEMDRDLLVTGALLHDIGKVEEYSCRTGIDFTDEGRLLGHIVLGVQMLDRYISQLTDFPMELKLKLTHMIVSHHGQYEWQSPKRPKFLEAAVLHHLDMIDAAANMFGAAVGSREYEDDSWTGWVKGLDRYVFCK